MTSQDDPLERLASLFDALRDLPPERRESAIDEACGDETELAAELRTLLAHHDAVTGPLAEPLSLRVDEADVAKSTMPRVGPYRLVRELGEGGMGVVHLAEQESPRRMVALKMLRPGLVGRSLLKRFAQESEILGRLQHPGIAAVYEAGTVDLGFGAQPYFAMEYVEGLPLTEYAERHRLDREMRLRLIVDVAEAVQHAHDRGVIHRDLKPANILVDATGRPRILDFGVARTIDGDAHLTTLRTDVGQLVGTIPYMSPEQLEGRREIDARSDIYAVGVLTYELLTGRLPHELRERSVVDALDWVRREDPTTLAAVDSQFRGDLDVIVGKALERDPARRYPSAAAMALDLRRTLGHQPIAARAPSVVYRTRKFVRRHRTLVTSVVLLIAVLTMATLISSLLAVEANTQRREARALSERLARDVTVQRIRTIAADLDTASGRAAMRMLGALPSTAHARWEVQHLHAFLDGSADRFSVDGDSILRSTVTADGDVIFAERGGSVSILHDPQGGRVQREIVRLGGELADMVTTRDFVVAASRDGSIVVASIHDGVERWRIAIDERVRSLLADERSRTVIVSGDRRQWRVFDLVRGIEREPLALPAVADSLGFAPDGHTVFVWLRRGLLCQIDSSTGAVLRELPGHSARASALAHSPDGAWFATADAAGTVIVRSRADGALLRTLSVPHGPIYVHTLAISPDGQTLLAGTDRGTVVAWEMARDLSLPQVIHLPESRVQSLLWHPERPTTIHAIAFPSGIFEINAGTILPPPKLPTLTRVAAAFDGNVAAIGTGSGAIILVCMRTGVQFGQIALGQSMVRALDCGADGRSFVALDGDGTLRQGVLGHDDFAAEVVDTNSRAPAAVLLHADHVAFSTSDGTIRIQRSDGVKIATVNTEADRVGAIRAAPSRRRFAAGDSDGRLSVWSCDGSLESMMPLVPARESSPTGVSAIAWIDEDTLAVGGDQGDLRVIDLRTRSTRWSVFAHPSIINAIAVTPDGSRLATASTDRTVRLFDTATGDEVLTLRVTAGAMHGILFSADGTTLLATALDGTVHFWRTDPERVVAERRRQREAVLAQGSDSIDASAVTTLEIAPEVADAYRQQAAIGTKSRSRPAVQGMPSVE